MERTTTDYNGKEHEVCATCGSVVGHGCPESEACDCEREPDEEHEARCVFWRAPL